ncbi:MAG TPA: tetratricopeptide repeat protein, partial [Rubrivivax sp.]|nr:tetratricopeptide repeat protein [Rubrivivax sp.]
TLLAPGEALFWTNLAQALRKLGELAAAQDAARRALTIDPLDSLACKLLGVALAEQHRYEEAVQAYAALPKALASVPGWIAEQLHRP